MKFRVSCGTQSVEVTLRDCLHAPDVPLNLLSVGTLQERRMRLVFDYDRTTIHFPSNSPLAHLSFDALFYRRLSFLQCEFIPAPPSVASADLAFPAFPRVELTPDLWHRRFGHLGRDATCAVLTKNYATGVEYKGPFLHSHCIPCLVGKRPQTPYDHHGHRASNICDLLHMDTCGPFPVLTPQKTSLFWTILDDASNYGHTALLAHKSDAFSAYLPVEASWELKSGHRVRAIRSDGAKELIEGKFAKYLLEKGITQQITAPYAHSQNGKAERYVRTLEDGAQTLLAESGLPQSFLGDATLTIQYLRNRLPTTTLPNDTTPYECMEKSKPDLSHLRVWGCQCFVHIPEELRTKGGPRRFEAIFVGYEENRVGWCVRDLNGKYHFSRDIIFNESVPGHLGSVRLPTSPNSDTPSTTSTTLATSRNRRTVNRTEVGKAYDRNLAQHKERLVALRRGRDHGGATNLALNDFISYIATEDFIVPSDFSCLRSHEHDIIHEHFLLAYYADPTRFQRIRLHDLSKPPDTYSKTITQSDAPVWHAAMQREVNSLEDQGVFERTTLPAGRKAIGCRWVYAYKYNPDGSIIRGKEKARLVAQGFSQRPEDYGSTYAPVAKTTSIRIVLAHAAHHDWEIFSFDVKTAFLHATLSILIYLKQIPGFPEADPKTVLRLRRAIYGLRQASFEFYTLLCRILSRIGLSRCEVDHAVFRGSWSSPPDTSVQMPPDGHNLELVVPVHVDDGLVTTNSISLYTWFLAEVSKDLEVVDLGPASLYLGIRIVRDRSKRKLWLSQKPFITDLLSTWNMTECHTASVPLRTKLHQLRPPPENALHEIPDHILTQKYQSLVGSLIYLAVCTRPDISYVACSLGQYNTNPTRAHMIAAKGVLRYLAGTVDYALEYGGGNLEEPVHGLAKGACGLSDSDWATDEMDRKSISGYCFYFLGSLVSWSAVKQRTIALSSTEAEYYAIAHGMKEGLWMRLFLASLDFPLPKPFPLICDNQGACCLSDSAAFSSRSKHIDVRYHFIRDHVASGDFSTTWIPTNANVADIMTKPLLDILFVKHRDALGLVRIT